VRCVTNNIIQIACTYTPTNMIADYSEIPRDASWGERYFHMLDEDGHELSFARQLR
jgi:hypothetical protein